MKSTKVVKLISVIFFTCIVLFGPSFLIGNQYESLLFASIFYGFSYYSILLILCAISIFIGAIFELFIHKINIVKIIEFVLGLYILFILSFYKSFFINTYYINLEYSFISYFLFITAGLLSLKSLSDLFGDNKLTVEDIVEIGIFVSLAVVLDLGFFKVKIGAQGGSISLAMLPLFLIALRKGFYKGFVASGIIYALITCVTDNYGFITFPFDYLLGFGSIAIIALFTKQIFNKTYSLTLKGLLFLTLGFWLSIFSRFCWSTLSGIIIYKLDFVGSLVYQLTYLGPSSAIVFTIILVLYKPLIMINKRYSYLHK